MIVMIKTTVFLLLSKRYALLCYKLNSVAYLGVMPVPGRNINNIELNLP